MFVADGRLAEQFRYTGRNIEHGLQLRNVFTVLHKLGVGIVAGDQEVEIGSIHQTPSALDVCFEALLKALAIERRKIASNTAKAVLRLKAIFLRGRDPAFKERVASFEVFFAPRFDAVYRKRGRRHFASRTTARYGP